MSVAAPTPPLDDTRFDATTRVVHGEKVVWVVGEVDLAAAPRFWSLLEAALPDPGGRLVVNLSETTFIDSTALGVLVRALKRLRHHGSEMVIQEPGPGARRIFQITGLDQILTIEPPDDAD